MTMKPDLCRPPVSPDSRAPPKCGLFAQDECQNGMCPEKASRLRDALIFGMLAARQSRRMRIF
jgi:hypothetical protein